MNPSLINLYISLIAARSKDWDTASSSSLAVKHHCSTELRAVAVEEPGFGFGRSKEDDDHHRKGNNNIFNHFKPNEAVESFFQNVVDSFATAVVAMADDGDKSQAPSEPPAPFFLTEQQQQAPMFQKKMETKPSTPSLSFLRAITNEEVVPIRSSPPQTSQPTPALSMPKPFFLADRRAEVQTSEWEEATPSARGTFPLREPTNLPDPVTYNAVPGQRRKLDPKGLFGNVDFSKQSTSPFWVNFRKHHEEMRGVALAATAAAASTGGLSPTESAAVGFLAATVAGLSHENLATLLLRRSGRFFFDRSLEAHNLFYPIFEKPLRNAWALLTDVALLAQQAVELPLVQHQWKAAAMRHRKKTKATRPAEVYEEYELYGGVRITNAAERFFNVGHHLP